MLAAVAAARTGGLVFALWAPLGLGPGDAPLDAPFPGLWRWFFALWLPGLFLAFTAAHAWLLVASGPAERVAVPARAAWQWDRASYALLPGFCALMAGANALGGWRWPLAAFYVGVLLAKALLLVATLYRGGVAAEAGDEARRDPRALGRALFLVALLAYGFLAPYVVTAVSAGGDEPLYLLNTASLAADGDEHIRNNVEQRAYAAFYWGRGSVLI